MYPKVKFEIDYQKDIKTLHAFAADAVYDNGRNLSWAIFKHYPQLKRFFLINKIRDKAALSSFVKNKYETNSGLMNKNLKIFAANWKKIEPIFFALVDELFENFHWPKGKYIAYFTIWSMFPRFLEDKTFQIPYKFRSRKGVSAIIAHEMLHFIFYEYFYSLFKKYRQEKYYDFVWNISEIFNVVVQNSSRWLKIFGVPAMSYTEHEKIIKKIKKSFIFNEKNDAKRLILEIAKKVKK
ncbi:MAG: hypothetical protein PHO56_05260 [Patescibacteria group bacterium]|nr:hypothetical protein [Patescibacteria group bacterium]